VATAAAVAGGAKRMDSGFEIVIISMLILVNGIFAMSEMAVITARKSRLQDWVKKGNSRAKAAVRAGPIA
jgi:CBS domain containing-hemolysin-like protein